MTVLVATGLATFAAAGDLPRRATQRPRQVKARKVESDVADMISRISGHRWHMTTTVDRLTLVPTYDYDENETYLGLVEFGNGWLGVYVARQNPDDDAWLTVAKTDLDVVIECLERSKCR